MSPFLNCNRYLSAGIVQMRTANKRLKTVLLNDFPFNYFPSGRVI